MLSQAATLIIVVVQVSFNSILSCTARTKNLFGGLIRQEEKQLEIGSFTVFRGLLLVFFSFCIIDDTWVIDYSALNKAKKTCFEY